MMGYLAWLFIFIGIWMVGNKRPVGFHICNVANVLLGVDAVMNGYYPNLIAAVAFTGLNCYNIWKWKRDV